MNKINRFCLSYYGFIIVAVGMLVLIGSIAILQQDIVVEVHDNLDGIVPLFETMKEPSVFMGFDGEATLLGGTSRLLMPSHLQLYSLIYFLLSPFWAYVTVFVLKILIGGISFYYLIKEILDKEKFDRYKNLIIIVGFSFGLLSGAPYMYLCQTSIPLVILILMRIYKNPKKIQNYIFILLYPVLSNMIIYGIFICGYLLLYIIYDLIKNRSKKLIVALLVLILGYFVVEYRLVYAIAIEGIATIKDSEALSTYGFGEAVRAFAQGFIHASSQHFYTILPLSVVYIVVHNVQNIINKRKITTIPNMLFALLIFNALVYWLYGVESVRSIFYSVLPPLNGVNFSRTIFFNPFVWYTLLVYIATRVYEKQKLMAIGLVILQLLVVVAYPSIYNDIYLTASDRLGIDVFKPSNREYYTFDEFYSNDLFDEIKADIDYDGQYSVAFRMHPAILNGNGISTLDGYWSYYPMVYKSEFAELALPQLQLDQSNMDYFGDWGGRAYLLSDEVDWVDWGYDFYNPDQLYGDDGEDLYINVEKFRELDGVYIFSNGEITNATVEGYFLVDKYSDEKSLYTIYVYIVE